MSDLLQDIAEETLLRPAYREVKIVLVQVLGRKLPLQLILENGSINRNYIYV